MTDMYEIEGELVRHVRREVVTEHTLEELLEHLERKPRVSLPLLPKNRVLTIDYDASKPPNIDLAIALEVPPQIRLLPIAENYLMPDGTEPRVACPWTVFVFNLRSRTQTPANGADWAITSSRSYFSNQPVTGQNDNLIMALLPNISDNGEICWGNTGAQVNQRLDERLDQLVNEFYTSTFTHGNGTRPWPYRRADYGQWARETAQHGRFAFRRWTDWRSRLREHYTLQDAMQLDSDRTRPIILPDGIPELNFNPTFGMAENWLVDLPNNNQRLRLETALANLRTERPELFAANPTPTPPADTDTEDEDTEDEDED